MSVLGLIHEYKPENWEKATCLEIWSILDIDLLMSHNTFLITETTFWILTITIRYWESTRYYVSKSISKIDHISKQVAFSQFSGLYSWNNESQKTHQSVNSWKNYVAQHFSYNRNHFLNTDNNNQKKFQLFTEKKSLFREYTYTAYAFHSKLMR